MSGIFDRRAKRFISTEQAERAVPSRTVMASRVARDDVNRSERVQKKELHIVSSYLYLFVSIFVSNTYII